MKYSSILLFLFSFIIFSTSCNKQGGKAKVGVLFASLDAKRFQKEVQLFKEKITELGGEAVIKSADNDESRQHAQAIELMDEGAEILVIIAVNVNTAAAIVRDAHERNVKVIAYDRLIRNCELDFFITFDGEKVGKQLAKFMVEKVPQGNYILINGDKADQNAVTFHNGTMKVLQPLIDSKKINIVYSGFMDDWSGDNAAYYTDMVLEFSNTKIDAIISQYDGMSDRIVSLLKERGMENKVAITGQDAEVAACNRIMNNLQAMTIYKPVKSLAFKCSELAFQILRNDKLENLKPVNNGRIDVPTIMLDPITVDKSNLSSTVVADGFLSMDEIMNYKE